MPDDIRYVQLRLPVTMHDALKREAEARFLPVTAVIRTILADHLSAAGREERQQAPVTGKGKPGPAAKPKWLWDKTGGSTLMRHAPPDIAAWEGWFVANTGRLSTWPPEVPDITVFHVGDFTRDPASHTWDTPVWYFMKNGVRVTVPSRYHLPDNGDWLCFRTLKDVEPYYDSVIRPAIREMYDGMNDAAQ